MNEELYEFGNFRLDVRERRLERLNGSPTNRTLREKAFEVLVHLVRNSGRLVTKDELIACVWPDAIVEETNLSKSIHAVRQFLGESAGEYKYIETVPKHGYRFVAYVTKIERGSNGQAEAAASKPINGVPEKSSAGGSLESTSAPETISDFRENAENVKLPVSNSNVLWAATVILIGIVGLGGLLVANNWRTTQTPLDSPPTNVQDNRSKAFDLYVRGKVKAGIENREEAEAAIQLLEEAVILDPNLAGAYAQLARVYNTKAFKFAPEPEQKHYYENAEVAIQKALELNPDLAEAHFARGLILWNKKKGFPHEQAIKSYKRSLELDPKQDEAHHQLSMVYAHIGLMDEAKLSLNKTLELNPNNTMARFRVGNYLVWEGKFEKALAVFKTVPSDVSPLLVERIKAEALIQRGLIDEAQDIVDDYLIRYPSDEGGSFTSVNALLLAKAGKRKEAEDAIGRAVEIGKGFGHFHHTAYNIASAYAALNEPEKAVKWLESAADDGFPCYSYFRSDPNLDSIRGHSRFTDLMSKLQRQWERFRQIG